MNHCFTAGKTQKVLSVMMAVFMLFSLTSGSVYAAEYEDIEGHWAAEAIQRWTGYGVMEGDDDGFRPGDSMTRAEAVTVFVRLLGLESTENAAAFSDTKGHWAEDAFAKVSAAGIMDGVGGGMADPEGQVTREQFFVMFARALGIREQETTSGPASDGADWSAGLINALTDKGYVRGDGSGVNAAEMIDRACMMGLLDQTISTYAAEDGATVTGTGEGVVLVVAEGVTVTGNVADLVVAEGAKSADSVGVTLENVAVSGQVIITAGVGVSIEGDAAVSEIVLTGSASGASVSIGKNVVVDRIETAAGDSAISVSGEVGSITATETAAGTEIEVAAGAKVGAMETEALGEALTIRDESSVPAAAAGNSGSANDTNDIAVPFDEPVYRDDEERTDDTDNRSEEPALGGDDDSGNDVPVTLPSVVSVTGVTLSPAALTLNLTDHLSAPLTATVAPENASNKAVRWSTSNAEVAVVSDGVVTAARAGTAAITVTTEDGTHEAVCTVTVSDGTYTVTLDLNYDSQTLSATTNTDGVLASLPVPTRKGYLFAGWFTAAEGGEPVDSPAVFHSNTTLYAHWESKHATMTIRITEDVSDKDSAVGASIDNATIVLKDVSRNPPVTISKDQDETYSLVIGNYEYDISAPGYQTEHGGFSVSADDAEKEVLTLPIELKPDAIRTAIGNSATIGGSGKNIEITADVEDDLNAALDICEKVYENASSNAKPNFDDVVEMISDLRTHEGKFPKDLLSFDTETAVTADFVDFISLIVQCLIDATGDEKSSILKVLNALHIIDGGIIYSFHFTRTGN